MDPMDALLLLLITQQQQTKSSITKTLILVLQALGDPIGF